MIINSKGMMVCFSCMRYEIMTVALWGKGYEAPVLLGFKLSILLEYTATDAMVDRERASSFRKWRKL